MNDKPNSHALVEHQKQRRETTAARTRAAIQTIEAEIKEHGTYPHNGGVVNLAEVCRRAGIGSTTLRNKHHRPTRDFVQEWLASLKRKGPTSKSTALAFQREKISFYEDALRKMNAEAVQWRYEVAALIEENKKLRKQIAAMSSDGATVVGMNRKKSTDD